MVEAVELEAPWAAPGCFVTSCVLWHPHTSVRVAGFEPHMSVGKQRCRSKSVVLELADGMVEAVGLEPTSEERVLETSTCVAFDLSSRQSR